MIADRRQSVGCCFLSDVFFDAHTVQLHEPVEAVDGGFHLMPIVPSCCVIYEIMLAMVHALNTDRRQSGVVAFVVVYAFFEVPTSCATFSL